MKSSKVDSGLTFAKKRAGGVGGKVKKERGFSFSYRMRCPLVGTKGFI